MSEVESLLRELLDQNERIITLLESIDSELSAVSSSVSSTNDELNWVGDLAFAKQVLDRLDDLAGRMPL
ncbi:hypothetical protein [Cellulosimicrobium sp. NPDC057862]|uniref:hypothetical protein n=1 Tax=Cellulosimicrobium sp. NPDC057862 TaxID=3346266 RepID=UPI00366F6DA9